MESKISIETNDNFQNFLLLLLSEFESKKIQEDLSRRDYPSLCQIIAKSREKTRKGDKE